jgi:hypothetical protein
MNSKFSSSEVRQRRKVKKGGIKKEKQKEQKQRNEKEIKTSQIN